MTETETECVSISVCMYVGMYLPKWLRRPPQEQQDLGLDSCLCYGDSTGSSHTSDLEIGTALQWLPCQAPGIIGSALGLVGLSVYCDWVR